MSDPVASQESVKQLLERTAPVEAALELERQARMFDATLSAISDFAYTFDREGRFTYVNKALLDLWGLPLAHAVGKNFFDLNYPEDLATRLQGQIHQVLITEEKLVDETPYTSPSGKVGHYEYIFSPVFDAQGRVEAVAGSTRDITARKRTESNLRDAQARLAHKADELERVNRGLEDFAHIVSHDLQAPLGKIAAFADLLKRELGTEVREKAAGYLRRVEESATRAGQLLSGLLRFSKSTATTADLENVDLNDVLRTAEDDLEVIIHEREADLEIGPLPIVRARRLHMHQLFMNLVANALKYSIAPPVRVRISARRDGARWIFAVKDSGMGMERSELKRIFDLFHRVNASVKDGSGIGLSICRKIVEGHGGEIWADSKPGKGSTFYFTLPIA